MMQGRPHQCRAGHPGRQRGFTLVEAVVVMVVTGIIAGIMVLFISRPVNSYVDSAARADLGDAADLALRRMARELRAAVPNSVRLSVVGGVSYLEFIPTRAGGRYLGDDDYIDTAKAPAAQPLSFSDASRTSFTVVGVVPAIAAGDGIVVYNLGPGFPGADAYAGGNRATVSAVNGSLVTLANNPFAGAATPGASPAKRFQVVQQPVTFRCEGRMGGGGTLRRITGYGFQQAQPVTADATAGALLADNVLACNFSVDSNANLQSALVGMNLALARAAAGSSLQTVALTHQIHVDNTP